MKQFLISLIVFIGFITITHASSSYSKCVYVNRTFLEMQNALNELGDHREIKSFQILPSENGKKVTICVLFEN